MYHLDAGNLPVGLHRPVYCAAKHCKVGLHRLVLHCKALSGRLAQTGILHYKALHGWPQPVGLHRMAAHAFFCKAMSDHTLCGTQSTDGDLKMHMNNVHIAQCSWDTCQFEDNFILTMTPIIHISPSQNLI